MYSVSKRTEIAGAHKLNLDYDSPCQNLHGHNWIVTVFCAANELDQNGMIVDFAKVKKAIHGVLDHQFVNEVIPDMNPTAENMAKWIADKVTEICCEDGYCYKVIVQESEGNMAMYSAFTGWGFCKL